MQQYSIILYKFAPSWELLCKMRPWGNDTFALEAIQIRYGVVSWKTNFTGLEGLDSNEKLKGQPVCLLFCLFLLNE